MWPLLILLNKLLKVEDESTHNSGGDYSSQLLDSCSCGQSSIAETFKDVVLPGSYVVEVPHINQLCTWDCGLACVLMALRTIGINSSTIQELVDLCGTTSIWTVDLAYLLQKLSVRFSYFTVTFGANPNFSVEKFYEEQLPNDLVRVNMLFQNAPNAGISIQCRSISEEEISLFILSGKYVAIALVDQYKLSHAWYVSDFVGMETSYAGHYILICGYDAGTDEFEFRDPASSRKHERISSKSLQEARRSFGTDEDLLLISLE